VRSSEKELARKQALSAVDIGKNVMIPLHKILHPTDLSERSQAAFHFACALAKDYGAQLLVLHVVPPGTKQLAPLLDIGSQATPVQALAALEEELRRLQPPDAAVLIEHRLEEGQPASVIVQVANDTRADLIVLGTHGRTGLSRVVMGSVAEQVVRRAGCAVVTVKLPFPRVSTVAERSTVSEQTSAGPVASGIGTA
jgi:nucleotide-binding universal stress UspA family protein